MVVNKVDGTIICTCFVKGCWYGFRLFKELKLKIVSKIRVVVDTGYVGITWFHVNLVIPVKCSKKRSLTMEDEVFNCGVLSVWVLNGCVVGWIKWFKFVSDRYCNRRKRFGLRFNLIAGICDYEQET
ncbi:MAG: hypothetical protein LBC12_07605 [Nitrososphaerota archaeon]|nr:hypothetical protein [Nitrososphaerota archaeon]